SPEGSRPANAIYLHSNLCLLGEEGLGHLIDNSCRLVSYMANKLKKSKEHELLLEPMGNILLYRWIPHKYRNRDLKSLSLEENEEINQCNIQIQEIQKSHGQSFVSR